MVLFVIVWVRMARDAGAYTGPAGSDGLVMFALTVGYVRGRRR